MLCQIGSTLANESGYTEETKELFHYLASL
jgi:hypothetical protein